jgi:hypothetical protein
MASEQDHAPSGPSVAGLDIRLRQYTGHKKLKQAERDAAIANAARLMREIDELDRGIADLIEQRLAVMMGERVEPMVDVMSRLAPFVGHSGA